MNARERFLAACRKLPVDRPPVWLMRQAGRYLPEYRELRSRNGFDQMLRTPALAVEASLQPVRRFGMDAAILFCDILVALTAMGVRVDYKEGGPEVSPRVLTGDELSKLRRVEPGTSFDFVADALGRVARELHPETAVLGFAGAPFTLAAYLVEGSPGRGVDTLKAMACREPGLYAEIADRISVVVAGLLRLQVDAGADAVQIFDTWAGHLSPDQYRDLALPYVKKVISLIADCRVPVILYVRNAAGLLEEAALSGADAISVDASLRLRDARARLDPRLCLQGNFDPPLLFAPEASIRAEVRAAISGTQGRGYIANLGRGVLPETPLEGVAAFVSAVREAQD